MQWVKWNDYCNLNHLALYLYAWEVSEVTLWMYERIVNEYIEPILFYYNVLRNERHITIFIRILQFQPQQDLDVTYLIFIMWGGPDEMIWREVVGFNEKLHEINNATVQ